MPDLPIDKTLVQKRAQIRKMLVQISYKDEKLAIKLLRRWVEDEVTISDMYAEVEQHLKDKQAV
ncbi:hypothetical protein J2S78_002104 [Salibacterium salarium]|uniref:hypothetical protein n=1 Tax=Salibacterium salarium TaxID=284579 RepID=UPI002781AAFC|nr:hypothetical protein [Salibacterium salarium]MDQ0299684.1 hypothetical protein [Salibacterium salarium]